MVSKIEVVCVQMALRGPAARCFGWRSTACSCWGFEFHAAATGFQPIFAKTASTRHCATTSGYPGPSFCASSNREAAGKPKKVITNDDLKGGSRNSGFSPADFSLINNCNRACFEQVRQQAHVMPAASLNWKRELLQEIEQVRKDDDWQKYLRDLYDIHVKFCNLGLEKREELAKYTDPNNVTQKELAIDEKYDAKFTTAQNELRALDSRQAALQRKYAGSPLAYQFTMIQASRIQTASCYAENYSANDADDP